MDDFELTELLHEVKCHLQHAVDEVFPDSNWCVPLPWCFGSQKYRLTGPKSDVDLLVLAPEPIVEMGDDIRAILARRLCDRGLHHRSLSDMRPLQTLKWSDAKRDVEVRVLLSCAARGQIHVTCFLRDFYAGQEEYRRVVQSVLEKLRASGALNSHGLGASVGQSVKTVSAALWCAGLKTMSPGLCTESDVLKGLAVFNASDRLFKIQRQESEDVEMLGLTTHTLGDTPSVASAWSQDAGKSTMESYIAHGIPSKSLVISEEQRRHCRLGNALLLLFEGQNSAEHLTQPGLAHFQYTCWCLCGDVGIPSSLGMAFMGLSAWPYWEQRSIQHFRFRPCPSRWKKDAVDFPVVTVWPPRFVPQSSNAQSAVVILAGNKNEIQYDTPEGVQLVVVTWSLNHETNPDWLPDLLDGMMSSLLKWYGEGKVHLIALSRGVQAFLACVANVRCLQWLQDIGHVCLAGGCLWQRQVKGAEQDVRVGMASWGEAKGDPKPVSVLVVSYADASVRFEGSYSRTKSRKSYRVDYGPLHMQLRDYVKEQYVLNVEQHSEVIRFACNAFNHFYDFESWPEKQPDFQVEELECLLLAVGNQAPAKHINLNL
jgi:hypothetical protein